MLLIWIYILIAILLLLSALMFVPIGIKARYTDSFKCVLTVGFLKFSLYPKKPKIKEKSLANKASEDKKNPKPKKNIIKEKGISWLLDVIKKTANLAAGALKDFFRHIIVKDLLLSVKIAGDDAADTAVKYGGCCSVVYPAFGLLLGIVKYKNCGVDITPDFNENAKTGVYFKLNARIRAVWIAYLAIKHGYKGIKLLADLKN